MTYTETFNEIAGILGCKYFPACWYADGEVHEDRGFFVFGDETDWRSPKFFIHKRYSDGKFECRPVARATTLVDGKCRAMDEHFSENQSGIFLSTNRTATALAADLKRRLINPSLESHDARVRIIEDRMVIKHEPQLWNTKMGLSPSGRGEVWRQGKARCTLEVQSFVCLTIDWLTRKQTERVVKFLKGEMK